MGWKGTSLQSAAGVKRALRRGVGSEVTCYCDLGYSKTGTHLKAGPEQLAKCLWDGLERLPSSAAEQGPRMLHIVIFK